MNQIHKNKKALLTIAFMISLLPMLLNQYGGRKGVQEITGLINLLNPIGFAAAVTYLVGVWVPFRKKNLNTVLVLWAVSVWLFRKCISSLHGTL